MPNYMFEFWLFSNSNQIKSPLVHSERADPNAFPVGSSEALQAVFWNITQLRMWENEWYQYQNGLFDETEFEPRLNLWRNSMSNPYNILVWEQARLNFSPDFRELLDNLIQEPNP